MDDAEFRAIAKAGRDINAESWDEARSYIEHTFDGRQYLLHERWMDVGRAFRGSPLGRTMDRLLDRLAGLLS